jgi:hypothetical protein
LSAWPSQAEFSAVREEIRAGDREVIRVLRAEFRAEFARIGEQMRDGDREVMSHARLLIEGLRGDVRILAEGLDAFRRAVEKDDP